MMNEVARLYNNIQKLASAGALEVEFQTFAEENDGLDSIEILNDIIEDELSAMADASK